MSIINLALRGFQFVWTLLVMALIGNMIADSNGHNASIVNYSLFVSIWGMLTLLYLIPASIKDSFQIHAMIPLILDVLNVIFWFCGAVALAAELGAHSCGNGGYLISNKVTAGSSKRCHEAQASCAFLWFGFAAFAASTVMSGLGMGGGSSARGGIRRGPAMSQV